MVVTGRIGDFLLEVTLTTAIKITNNKVIKYRDSKEKSFLNKSKASFICTDVFIICFSEGKIIIIANKLRVKEINIVFRLKLLLGIKEEKYIKITSIPPT